MELDFVTLPQGWKFTAQILKPLRTTVLHVYKDSKTAFQVTLNDEENERLTESFGCDGPRMNAVHKLWQGIKAYEDAQENEMNVV